MSHRRRAATVLGRCVLGAGVLLASGCTTGDEADQRPTTPASTTRSVPTTVPTTMPTTVPTTVPTGRPAIVRVTIVGDIMLGRRVGAAAAAAGDPSAPLRPMTRELARADITVGNLESTLSDDGEPRQGDDSFAAPPAVLSGLREAGFDVLTLANNHTGDYGRAALVETVRAFEGSGIAPVGAGADTAEAWRPVVVERNGVRVGFLAFNAIGETWRTGPDSAGAASLHMQPRTGDVVPAELDRLAGRVRRLTDRTDVTIVLPHWGEQYTHRPVPDQLLVGRRLLAAGATMVVGGHPHWVQDVQRHRGRFVVHSLGNFVFDMDFMRQTQEGIVLHLTFRSGELVQTRPAAYVIGPDFAPRPAREPRRQAILADIDGLQLLPLP